MRDTVTHLVMFFYGPVIWEHLLCDTVSEHFSVVIVVYVNFIFIIIFEGIALDITLQPLYNTVRYNMVFDITRFKDGTHKMYRLYWKMTINGHFSI